MCKKQQMRWSAAGAQLLLHVRTADLNGRLGQLARRRDMSRRPIGDIPLLFETPLRCVRPSKFWAPWRSSSSERKPLRTLPQAHDSGLFFTGDASVILAGVGPPPKTQESLLLA
jgi:hypothetical protein